MEMIRLSHGTSARHLDSILTDGLRARGTASSVWDCESDPRMVYLTTAYSLFFALNAAEIDEDALIVEVSLPVSKLYCDEDVYAQATYPTWEFRSKFTLAQYTQQCRNFLHTERVGTRRRKLACESLRLMGTACYRGTISPNCITRIARIGHEAVSSLVMKEADPVLSILNYQFFEARYRRFQDSLFDRFPVSFGVSQVSEAV